MVTSCGILPGDHARAHGAGADTHSRSSATMLLRREPEACDHEAVTAVTKVREAAKIGRKCRAKRLRRPVPTSQGIHDHDQ
jgi:hypothetical protein